MVIHTHTHTHTHRKTQKAWQCVFSVKIYAVLWFSLEFHGTSTNGIKELEESHRSSAHPSFTGPSLSSATSLWKNGGKKSVKWWRNVKIWKNVFHHWKRHEPSEKVHIFGCFPNMDMSTLLGSVESKCVWFGNLVPQNAWYCHLWRGLCVFGHRQIANNFLLVCRNPKNFFFLLFPCDKPFL